MHHDIISLYLAHNKLMKFVNYFHMKNVKSLKFCLYVQVENKTSVDTKDFSMNAGYTIVKVRKNT